MHADTSWNRFCGGFGRYVIGSAPSISCDRPNACAVSCAIVQHASSMSDGNRLRKLKVIALLITPHVNGATPATPFGMPTCVGRPAAIASKCCVLGPGLVPVTTTPNGA
jgi:hypothetical protein